jgi:hypothetical protein
MSGLLFLSGEDFSINGGTKGSIMCHAIPGFSLILFYSTQCDHCQTLIPIFKKLPGSISGCQFGMINVSTNKTCVRMSKSTISPITYVPYIVLYVEGKPFMSYKGPHESGEIRRFVFEVAQKVQGNQKFSNEKVKNDPEGRCIPQYTIGRPLYGPDDKVCYLEFDTAYDKEGGQQGPGQQGPPGHRTGGSQQPQQQYQQPQQQQQQQQQPQQQQYQHPQQPQQPQQRQQYQQQGQQGQQRQQQGQQYQQQGQQRQQGQQYQQQGQNSQQGRQYSGGYPLESGMSSSTSSQYM